jgi:hypothetical protein
MANPIENRFCSDRFFAVHPLLHLPQKLKNKILGEGKDEEPPVFCGQPRQITFF